MTRLTPEMERTKDERVKQVAIGVSILVVLTVVVTGLLMGWRLLPGLLIHLDARVLAEGDCARRGWRRQREAVQHAAARSEGAAL